MMDVLGKRCGYEGCLKHPSYGVARSKKVEVCAEHARAGMVDVVNKGYGVKSCQKHPSYGVVGSKKAEFCAERIRAGMVSVVKKKVRRQGLAQAPIVWCSRKQEGGVLR